MRLFCSILILSLFFNALGATTTVANYLILDNESTTRTIDSKDNNAESELSTCCSNDGEDCGEENGCCGDNCDCQCCHVLAVPTLQVSESNDEGILPIINTPSTKSTFFYQSKKGLNHVNGLFQPPRA